MSSLGERLRQARERLGLQQHQVADELAITQAAVSFHETGNRQPSPRTIFRYAALYGLEPDALSGVSFRTLYRARLGRATRSLDRAGLEIVCAVAEALRGTQPAEQVVREAVHSPRTRSVAEAKSAARSAASLFDPDGDE